MEKVQSVINYVTSSYKRSAAALFIFAALLSIPLTLSIFSQSQDIRQRAAVSNDICVVLRPDGPGSTTQWTTVQGASEHWQAVSEETQNADTSYIENTAGSWKKDSFTLPSPNIPSDAAITKVDVTARAKSNNAPTSVNLDILVNGASQGTVRKTTTIYTNFTNSFTNNPGTGNPWTISDIDGLEIGVGSSGLQVIPRVTQVYATVCYATPEEATATPTVVATATPTSTPAATFTPTPTSTTSASTVPICGTPTTPPPSGPVPLEVTLTGAGTAGGPDSTIVGYQWDFRGDGAWDTLIKLEPVTHTYILAGTVTPKFRIRGANQTWSETCTYPFSITIDPANTTYLGLNLSMTGIGATTSAGIINDPVASSRSAEVMVFNTQNQQVGATTSGTVNFNPVTGLYEGLVNLGSNFASGAYLVKVRLDNTLFKNIPGIQNITARGDNNTQTTVLVSGDLNHDNVIDLLDYNIFISCFGNKTCAQKTLADLNSDGLVNEVDLNILYTGFTVRDGD